MNASLSDLSVIEYAQGVAGPYCGKLLADLGADVLKVEPPAGDQSRRTGPFPDDRPDAERSGQFVYLNANKRGVTLNVEDTAGGELLRRLTERADILITDLAPSGLEALGLDFETLRGRNERLIQTCITPYGLHGPRSDWTGNAYTIYQESGMARETPAQQVTDPPHQPPLSPGNPQADYFTGLTAAADTMVAVLYRATYGHGQLVDVSGLEANTNHVRMTWSTLAHTPDLLAGRAKSTFSQVVECTDGHAFLSPYGLDHWWLALREMMGDPEWAREEAYLTQVGRNESADVIEPYVHQWARGHSKDELYQLGIRYKIPCFPVNSPGEMFDSPQYAARGFFLDVDHPQAGPLRMPGAPVQYSRSGWAIERPAPRLGEHNVEVFGEELGHDPDQLRAMFAAGTI